MLVLAQSLGRPPLPRFFVISRCVHVSQNHPTRIDGSPLARVDEIHAKRLDGVRNFSHPPRQCGGNRRSAFVAVHRGKRLDPALGSWNDSLAARAQRTRKQPVKPFCRKVRQVAGDNQIPSRTRCGQSGGDSGQRPTPWSISAALSPRIVLDCAQSELRVPTGRSNNYDLGDKWLEQLYCMEDQWDAAEIEKSLVAAHARTGASCENEAGDLSIALHSRPAILRLRAEVAQRSGGL